MWQSKEKIWRHWEVINWMRVWHGCENANVLGCIKQGIFSTDRKTLLPFGNILAESHSKCSTQYCWLLMIKLTWIRYKKSLWLWEWTNPCEMIEEIVKWALKDYFLFKCANIRTRMFCFRRQCCAWPYGYKMAMSNSVIAIRKIFLSEAFQMILALTQKLQRS